MGSASAVASVSEATPVAWEQAVPGVVMVVALASVPAVAVAWESAAGGGGDVGAGPGFGQRHAALPTFRARDMAWAELGLR